MLRDSHIEQNAINRYRMLILNGTFVYPIWSFVNSEVQASGADPLWIRLLISGFMAGILGLSYLIPGKRNFLSWGLISSGWILTLHTIWICWQSQLSSQILCGLLICACCLLNILPTRKSTIALALPYALFGAVVLFVDHHWQIHPVVVNFILWSAIVPSVSANFTRLQNLNLLSLFQNESKALVKSMSEGLMAYSADEQLIAVNPAASAILGIPIEQFPSQFSTADWVCYNEDGRMMNQVENPILRVFLDKNPLRNQVVGVTRPDGALVWLKMNASTFQNSMEAKDLSVLFTFTDISDSKKSQKMINEQKMRLDSVAKMAALGEIAAAVAHEVNNPLAIIEGKVFNMLRGLRNNKLAEPIETSLEKISATVFRIQRITKGLQAFSYGGNEETPFKKIKFANLIEDALGYCQEKIRKNNVKIKINCDSHLELECRMVQISQVLINLVQNACDATASHESPWIRIWARSAHNLLVVTVTDSGSGIPENIRDKIMQPFFTTKEIGEGTGLGLSISQGLLNSHLGRIWVDPSFSNTTFVVELPLEQNQLKKSA